MQQKQRNDNDIKLQAKIISVLLFKLKTFNVIVKNIGSSIYLEQFMLTKGNIWYLIIPTSQTIINNNDNNW